MYSHLYYYFQIRSDQFLSKSADLQTLRAYLDAQPELIRFDDHHYKNAETFPWLEMTLLFTQSSGTYSNESIDDTKTNYIAIVGSKKPQGNHGKYQELLTRIAKHLGWDFLEEEEGDHTNGKIIYSSLGLDD